MSNPAPAAILEVALGGTRDGRLTGLRARLLFETGGFAENSIEGIAAILTVGPYHWDAHETVAYGVETNRVGTGAYRAPGAPAGDVRPRTAARRAGRPPRDGPDRAQAPQRGRPRRRDGRRHAVGRDRPRRMPRPAGRPSALPRPGVIARWRGGRDRRRGVAGRPPACLGHLPSRGRRPGDGRDRGRRHVRDDDRLRHDRRRGAGHRRPRTSRWSAADTASATRSPVSGGSVITYSTGRAVQRATDALREKILAYAAILLEIDVRDLELVDGSVQPKGTPERGDDAWPRSASRSTASRPTSSRWKATAARSRRSWRRSPRPISSTSGSTARPARSTSSTTSSPRTSAGRSTRRSSRASSMAARRRVSAGRSTRRWSTTRTASC